jgi:hypothetical protein
LAVGEIVKYDDSTDPKVLKANQEAALVRAEAYKKKFRGELFALEDAAKAAQLAGGKTSAAFKTAEKAYYAKKAEQDVINEVIEKTQKAA